MLLDIRDDDVDGLRLAAANADIAVGQGPHELAFLVGRAAAEHLDFDDWHLSGFLL